MDRQVRRQFDVLVVGAGPAGIAAAVRSAEHGLRVGMIDDNPNLGGQIWRGDASPGDPQAEDWIHRLRALKVEVFCSARIFDRPVPGILHAEGPNGVSEFSYDKLVLATGARELFLPFPGWTLPNVMGAGGLQALVKSGLPIAGKRVVVAGTGPLLLAVAASLRQHGAEIPLICEQASWSLLARFGIEVLLHPNKVAQGLSLRKELSGVPFRMNCWPVGAEGSQVLEAVMVSRPGKSERISCDYLACGFHLVPNAELAVLLGCRLHSGYVEVDEFQQTSIAEVFCVGEPTGIGGMELALTEGQIAGLAIAGQKDAARALFSARKKLKKFADVLETTFRLRDDLRRLSGPETIVCRCEDATYGRVQTCGSWRAAKLQTRCGMGPCQGRVCGPATQFIFGWSPDSLRPPVFPVRLDSLAAAYQDGPIHSQVTGGHG